MNRKRMFFSIGILIIILALGLGSVVTGCAKRARETIEKEEKAKISYWTCGMHPSVRVTDAEYKKGKKNCPICNMPLVPVYEEKKPETRVQKPEEAYYGCGVKEEGHCPHCDEGIEDAKCICGKHSFMIKGQKMNCPVCGKELVKIEPKDALRRAEENIISRITLKGEQLELAGVKTEPVTKQHLTKQIRTVGKIAFDPELAVAQEEFLTAVETRQKVSHSTDPDVIKRANDLVEKSKFKLRLLGMSDDEVVDLEKEGTAQLHLVLPEDKVWIYADVYEYELGWVKIGQEVLITTTAYPGEEFKGTVKSINPVINPMTRSAQVRIEAANLMKKLKPEMFADVVIESMYVGEDGSHETLSVPRDAVLDTGVRKVVYTDVGDGTFLGKEVKVGPEVTAYINGEKRRFYPVISGLKEGERVVTGANFLIDSQSQLSGVAASAYGGALGAKEETKPPIHKH